MKRTGRLLAAIADPENFRAAFLKAARGKRDRGSVRAFQEDLGANLARLREQVLSGVLDVGHYRFFHVHDPKRRLICAAAFPERVLHHAVMNVCEPVLERSAIGDSYACRTGKGSRAAVTRARQFARAHPWYLKLDIRKYFASIDHGVALDLLSRHLRERAVVDLFARILATYCSAPGKGVPIGNLVSQHLANHYLGGFDHWVKEIRRVPGYLRYMDDFLLFGDSRVTLREELGQVRTWLSNRLGLALKQNVQLNKCARGIPFLGYRVQPGTVRLGTRSARRFRARLAAVEARLHDGTWDEALAARHVEPLVDFTRFAAADGFRKNVLKRLRVGPEEARTG